MTPSRVAVAYSAGRDSTALLHATAHAAAAQGVEVLALHVHHGLSPLADDWLVHAQTQCRQWAQMGLPVRLIVRRLTVAPAPGESVEAWARAARYRALREMAVDNGAAVVLLAHHRRDQAETLLLQALRGAGVAGLSGMPSVTHREGIAWVRPWLSQPREAIEHYLAAHGLSYIDDDSNSQPRFARNRLRLQVWPQLVQAFPDAEGSLAAAATWAQDAAAVLAEVAAHDLAGMAGPRGLQRSAWLGLSPARRAQALKAWLHTVTGVSAPSSLLVRLQSEWPTARDAQWPAPQGCLHHHRGCLVFTPGDAVTAGGDAAVSAAREASLSITRAGSYGLPGWGGVLRVQRVKEGGTPLAWLAHLTLQERAGGEQFQAGLGRPARSLKKQYQAAEVPAWLRDGPLVYSGGQLVFVPGLGLDTRVLALPGQPQVSLLWERSS